MNKAGCSEHHNLNVKNNHIIICPEVENQEVMNVLLATAQWYKKEITYELCDEHYKKKYNVTKAESIYFR